MTTQSPAERLQRALEEYWPEGCRMFRRNHDSMIFFLDDAVSIHVNSVSIPWAVATIAAVAAAWWRVITSNTDSQKVRLKSINATIEFLAIYEAATEVA